MRESYKVEMSCELASHKEFRHACLRSVIAPKIVYFVGFLIMSPLADTIAANSGGRRCKEKRKVGHTSKGFQNRCSTIQTRLGLRKPSMYTGEVRVSADTAVISLGVNARDKDVLKAQQKVNETIAAIRAALIEKGVKEEKHQYGLHQHLSAV